MCSLNYGLCFSVSDSSCCVCIAACDQSSASKLIRINMHLVDNLCKKSSNIMINSGAETILQAWLSREFNFAIILITTLIYCLAVFLSWLLWPLMSVYHIHYLTARHIVSVNICSLRYPDCLIIDHYGFPGVQLSVFHMLCIWNSVCRCGWHALYNPPLETCS